MHRRILAAATPDDAGRAALTLAIALARPLGARVVIGAVVVHHGDVPPSHDARLDDLLGQLEVLRAEAPADVPMTLDGAMSSSIVRGLHDLAERHDAQLLVLGPTHRGAVARALRGDIAADVVFTAPCGVAVAVGTSSEHPPRQIGVGWDGSAEADEALEWAIQLAERTGGSVHILRVADPAHAEGSPADQGDGALLEALRQAAESRATATAELLWGDPGSELARMSQHLELLVLGSRARGPVRRTLLGSVSSEVLHHGRCPMLVLPRGVHAPVDTAGV